MKLILQYFLFGVLSFISWNYIGILFIPAVSVFFIIITQSLNSKWFVFLFKTFILVLILNVSVTFWLIGVSWWESILAYLGNSFLMLIPIFFTYLIVNNKKYFLLTFSILWVLYEILHTQWDLAWSWLTFGHAMGNMHYFVQWYSIGGVYFGTLWIITLGFMLMNLFQLDSFNKRYFLQFLTLLLIPLIFSLFLYFVPGKNNSNTKITTYIPSNKNITNYQKTKKLYFDLEKFNTTELIVCPEVFLKPINIYSNSQQNQLTFLDKLLNKKQNTNLVFGVELKTNSTLFNSIFIKNQEESLYRIKQKFVPLREFTPKLFEKTFNIPSYYSKNKNDFTEKIKKKYGFIPIICYESIFSIFIAKNSSNSDFILLSTSEQFLNNSYFGKKQYLDIVRLRTIENGRYIVKCSNQGISCVINEKGRIVKSITKEIENIKVQRINKNTIYQSLISFFLHVRNC